MASFGDIAKKFISTLRAPRTRADREQRSGLGGAAALHFEFDRKDASGQGVEFRHIRIENEDSGAVLATWDVRDTEQNEHCLIYGFRQERRALLCVERRCAFAISFCEPPDGVSLRVVLSAKVRHAPLRCRVTTSAGHGGEAVIASGINEISLTPGARPDAVFGKLGPEADQNNVSLQADTNPSVSVILLTYNKSALAALAAMTVLSSRIGVPYEIIIVENGGMLASQALLEQYRLPVRLLPLPANASFGEANNLGVEAARGNYLLLLNNDAFLQPGLVDELLRCFSEQPDAAAAGPVFRYMTGKLQEAGAFVNADGSSRQRGKVDDFDLAKMPRFEVVDYVSAACLMISKEAFNRIGGFSYRFEPAYYEDTDLCLRLNLIGKRVMVARDAVCLHVENATTSDHRSPQAIWDTSNHNRQVFLDLWQPYLTSRKEQDLPKIAIAPKSRVAFASASNAVMTPLNPISGSRTRYALAAACALAGEGGAEVIAPIPSSSLRVQNLLREFSLPPMLRRSITIEEASNTTLRRFLAAGEALYPAVKPLGQTSLYHWQGGSRAMERTKAGRGAEALSGYRSVLVSSAFAAEVYREQVGAKGQTAKVKVIYPSVALDAIQRSSTRKPWILSAGRFSPLGSHNRQDVLIRAFKATPVAFRKDWKLILAGHAPNDAMHREHLRSLQEQAASEPNIAFVLSPPASAICSLLADSAIFASATGFGIRSPDEMHLCDLFGTSLVEAALSGCLPLGYETGCAKEVFAMLGTGVTYGSLEELVSLWSRLADKALTPIQIAASAKERFADDVFQRNILETFA